MWLLAGIISAGGAGVNLREVRRMMNSISSLAWRFSSHRMVADYTTEAYLPAAGGTSCKVER
ncbi:MAG: hypothetical protein LBT46_08620 [Planctomycetaceae bacterium]|nr:hypothetical protein [Planctomycetaceae bacterium]